MRRYAHLSQGIAQQGDVCLRLSNQYSTSFVVVGNDYTPVSCKDALTSLEQQSGVQAKLLECNVQSAGLHKSIICYMLCVCSEATGDSSPECK